MSKALERHEAGQARVLPVILRPVDWEKTPISKLSALPIGGMPITLWGNQDEAFSSVAKAIRETVETLYATRVEQEIQKAALARCERTLYKDRIVSGTGPETTHDHWWSSSFDREFEERIVEGILSDYDRAIRDDPENPLFHQLKGDLHLHRGSYWEAFDSFNRAVYLKPAYAIGHIGRGRALVGLEKYQDAVDAFDRANQLNPRDAIGYIEKGCVLTILGRYSEALAAYKHALHHASGEVLPLAYQATGDILRRLERYSEAIIAYDLTTQLIPSNRQIWQDKAEILVNLKRYDEAVIAYQQALKLPQSEPRRADLDPGRAALYRKIGDLLKLLKRYDEALAAYKNSFSDEVDNHNKIYLHGERGALLALLNRYDEAIEAYLAQAEVCRRAGISDRESYEHVVQLPPTSTSARRVKARAFNYLKRYDEAIIAYQQALEHENDAAVKADTYLEVANLFQSLNRYDEALKAYDQAIQLRPNLETLKKLIFNQNGKE